jgi:hypothetical protein
VKTILGLCAAILIVGSIVAYRATRSPDRFGEFTGAPEVPTAEVVKNPRGYLNRTISLEGVVRDQGLAMGCHFFFREGKDSLRVDLQDIAMNAPRREGRRVRVEGRIVPSGDGFQLSATAVEFQ